MRQVSGLHICLFVFISFVVQMAFAENLKFFGARPDFIAVSVTVFAVFYGEGPGMEAGILGGLLKDIFSVDFFGINTFVFALCGYLAGVFGSRFSGESAAARLLTAFLFTAAAMSLHQVIGSALTKGAYISFWERFARHILPSALYTGLAAIPVIRLYEHFKGPDALEDLL